MCPLYYPFKKKKKNYKNKYIWLKYFHNWLNYQNTFDVNNRNKGKIVEKGSVQILLGRARFVPQIIGIWQWLCQERYRCHEIFNWSNSINDFHRCSFSSFKSIVFVEIIKILCKKKKNKKNNEEAHLGNYLSHKGFELKCFSWKCF